MSWNNDAGVVDITSPVAAFGLPMKSRSFYSILVAVVIALLTVGATGFYWLVAGSPLQLLKSGQIPTPAAAIFVSRQAPVVASLLVNPDQLAGFRQVVAQPADRRQARREMIQIKERVASTLGLDYEQDIQPWLGSEVTLAVTTLDIDRDRSNGQQPGYLLAIATKSSQQSREFLQLFWQKRAIGGTDLLFEQYKGVKLIYGSVVNPVAAIQARVAQPATGRTAKKLVSPEDLPPLTLASAVVGDKFVLFANSPNVLRDAITNAQAPDLSLTSASYYDKALAALTRPRIGLTFINLPRLAELLALETGTPLSASTPDQAPRTASPPDYQTLALAFGVDRQGVMAETALVPASGKGKTVIANLNQPVAALAYIPASSPIVAAGTDLNTRWGEFSELMQQYPGLAQLVNQPLALVNQQWQLDLPKDLFQWVDGDYALGVVPGQPVLEIVATGPRKKVKQGKTLPADRSVVTSSGDEWVFVVRRTGPKAIAGIEQLDAIAQKQGLSTGKLNLGDQKVSAWTRLSLGAATQPLITALAAEVKGVHATIGNYEVFASSIAALDQALQSSQSPLKTTTVFKRTTEPLQRPNQGYVYVDWVKAAPNLERQFPLLKTIEFVGQPLFQHLRSLAISSYGSEAGVKRGAIFFHLSESLS